MVDGVCLESLYLFGVVAEFVLDFCQGLCDGLELLGVSVPTVAAGVVCVFALNARGPVSSISSVLDRLAARSNF